MPKILQYLFLVPFAFLSVGCSQNSSSTPTSEVKTKSTGSKPCTIPENLNYAWKTELASENCICSRIDPPEGFNRTELISGSFAEWLRHIPLKPGNPDVLLFDGNKKGNQGVHIAVLDIDVGNRDLQQCADAAMRLRAEYLFANEQADQIHFNFTSGDKIPFSRWAGGEKPSISGNTVKWVTNPNGNASYQSFRKYLDVIFSYAGTASLSNEMVEVTSLSDIQIGDLFIKGGFPGHAVTVMDIAVHEETGEKIFLLSQSYMPAQEIHILKNPMNDDLSPWYSVNFEGPLETPEWTFKKENLKRYPD